MAYTAVPTVTTGELWTAANHNTYIKDNMTAIFWYAQTPTFVQAIAAYNQTDTSEIELGNQATGYTLPDSKLSYVHGGFYCPQSPATSLTITPVVYPGSSGNVYCWNLVQMGADGEDYNTHQEGDGGYGAQAVTASPSWNFLSGNTLSNIAAGDIVRLTWIRDGTDASDTVNNYVRFIGWIIDRA